MAFDIAPCDTDSFPCKDNVDIHPVNPESLEHLGAEALLHVAIDGAGRVLVRVDPDRAAGFVIGNPVALRPDQTRLLWFDSAGARVRPGGRLREVARG